MQSYSRASSASAAKASPPLLPGPAKATILAPGAPSLAAFRRRFGRHCASACSAPVLLDRPRHRRRASGRASERRSRFEDRRRRRRYRRVCVIVRWIARTPRTWGRLLRPAEQLDRGFAAALVPDAYAAPRNGVPESLARRLFGGEESREAFGPVALAHRVCHLALGIDLAREPRELALAKAITRNVCQVEADCQRSLRRLRHPRCRSPRFRARSSLPRWIAIIRIVPINTVDITYSWTVSLPVSKNDSSPLRRVERSLVVPRSSLNATRGQLFVSTLISKVHRAHPEPGHAVAGDHRFRSLQDVAPVRLRRCRRGAGHRGRLGAPASLGVLRRGEPMTTCSSSGCSKSAFTSSVTPSVSSTATMRAARCTTPTPSSRPTTRCRTSATSATAAWPARAVPNATPARPPSRPFRCFRRRARRVSAPPSSSDCAR